MQPKRFAIYAWFVLVFTLLVVLWGAFVRATGSGAGCGNHWPLCNGVVVPRAPQMETMIEFSHRLSSGLNLLLVLGLIIWGFRLYGRGHPIRRGLLGAGLFIIMEALIGAGLVLFGLTADNDSRARAISMALHLVNTFLLMAALAYTAWLASGQSAPRFRGQGLAGVGWWVGLAGVVFVGMSGAITALGDTLYPSRSLAEALAADLSPASHLFIRLRMLHPAVTLTVGSALIAAGLLARRQVSGEGGPSTAAQGPGSEALASPRRWGTAVAALSLTELAVGIANLLLLAPVWMQLIHLLIADLLWISYVLLGATLLGSGASPARRVSA